MAVVYIFVSKDMRNVLYVGSTNVRSAVRSDRDALKKRVLEHRNCGEGFLARSKIPENDVRVFFLENLTKEDASFIELVLISLYDPEYNRIGFHAELSGAARWIFPAVYVLSHGDEDIFRNRLIACAFKEYDFTRR